MTELVFRGAFEVENSEIFMEKLEQLFEDTGAKFRGQVLQFEVDNYTDYEEVTEEMIEQTNEENDDSSDNGSNEDQEN